MVASDARVAAIRQQAQPAIEILGQRDERHRAAACRGEFDCERIAVQAPADLVDDRGVFGEVEPVIDRFGAGREQRDRVLVRQRRESVDPLAGRLQRLAAGREDAHPLAGTQQLLAEPRGFVEDVLAVVEDDDRIAATGEGDQRLQRRPVRGTGSADDVRHRRRKRRPVGERREVDEPHPGIDRADQRLGDA